MTQPTYRRAALAGAASLPLAGLLPGGLGAQVAWKPSEGVRIVVPATPGLP